MAKFVNYQKRPRLVEAWQIWYNQPIPEEVFEQITIMPDLGYFAHQQNGELRKIPDGGWVIRERDGVHVYPVSDEIFRAMYDEYTGK